VTAEATDRLPVRSRLEKAIWELQGLHELLHSGELDPQILADFRDALNRVRNTAWAAQQYANRRRAMKTQLMFFRSWRENEFVPPTMFVEPSMKT
jgi:hypothetical protein